MTARRITFELTEAEARNLLRLAECAANTYEDAANVLVESSKVRAAYRAIDKMTSALYGQNGQTS